MGSGKSSVGRILAPRLNRRFVDTDKLIVQSAGTPITEIFKNHGETYFRDLETSTLSSLENEEGLVVATGGGIILRENNVALLRKLGFVIWLRTSEERIYERVSRNNKRPLVQTANPRETIHKLLTERTPLYTAAAQFVVDTCDKTHDEVADAIIAEMGRLS